MKIFQTTQMRSGTHLLSDVITHLTGMKWDFIPSGYNLSKSKLKEYVNKKTFFYVTHDYPPKKISDIISDKVKIITIRRNIYDQISSYILYIRYAKVIQRKDMQPLYAIRNNYGNKNQSNKDYINGMIKSGLVDDFFSVWNMYKYDHFDKLFVSSYEKLCNSPIEEITKISNFLNVDKCNAKLIANKISFKTITGRNPGDNLGSWKFRNFGKVGEGRKLINNKSKQYIKDLL